MKVTPLPDEAVLLLEPSGKRAENEKVLVLADLHIGYESSLVRSGVRLPSQTEGKFKHLSRVLNRTRPDRVVILGDVKHKVQGVSFQEREEVPRFFERLLSKVKAVDVVIGNHDAGLKELLPEAVKLHQNLVIDDIGMTHGHIWPSDEVMACDTIIIGHNHSTVVFKDELGQRVFYQCWIRTGLDPEKTVPRYKKANKKANCIVLPSFEVGGTGTPVNLEGMKLLGPLLAHQVFKRGSARAYLLDGTFLGQISDIWTKDPELLREKLTTLAKMEEGEEG